MSTLGFIAGGLLEGVGGGMLENVKAMREEAQAAAARRDRAETLQMSADLNDRNSARDDDRRTVSRAGEMEAQNKYAVGMVGVQGEESRKTDAFQNGLLAERDAAKFAQEDKQDSRQFGHDAAMEARRAAREDVREGRRDAREDRKDRREVRDASGYTSGEGRMVKALEKRFTTEDERNGKTTDFVAMANSLGEQGRPDLAADFDPRWRAAAEKMTATGRAPGYDRVAASRNARRAAGEVIMSNEADPAKQTTAASPPARSSSVAERYSSSAIPAAAASGAPTSSMSPKAVLPARQSYDPSGSIANARAAIAAGAPREAVIRKLMAAGISTKGL